MIWANLWGLIQIPVYILVGAIVIFLVLGVFRSVFMGRIGD
jgi:hypothetical protein